MTNSMTGTGNVIIIRPALSIFAWTRETVFEADLGVMKQSVGHILLIAKITPF